MKGTFALYAGYLAIGWVTSGGDHELSGQTLVTARPVDTGAALVNPGMGWLLHYYDNSILNYGGRLDPSDAVDDFPGLSVIYFRIPWSYLEPEEGKFNWSYVDTPAQRWIDKGLRIAFRFTASETGIKFATPEWVKAAGAQGHYHERGKIVEQGRAWEPDFGDAVFLEKLENFMKAAAERYDGNPNVEFIEIGTLGVWGEGHTYASTRLNYSLEVMKKHIDLHLKYFTRTTLIGNDDFSFMELPFEYWEKIVKTDAYQNLPESPIVQYCLEQGLGLRDDSILVLASPRHYFRQGMAELFWRHVPVIVESDHYGASKRNNAWGDGSMYVQSVEDYHASYASIHWWPREFLEEQRGNIDKMNLRLGYRLVPHEVSWKREVNVEKPFEVSIKWSNRGVAPCCQGGYVAVTLKDERGGITGVFVDPSFNVRSLEVGPAENPPFLEITSRFSFGVNMPKGEFDVFISVGRNDGTPVIALPLSDEDENRRYRIGKISIR
jgi:hypothetical protein